jgi:hypothetical protein
MPSNIFYCLGESPVRVSHSVPGGTVQLPWQSYTQSVFLMISFWAVTNVSTGHMPSFCLGQPRIPVSGATPSLMMIRICGPGNEVHSKTNSRDEEGWWTKCNIHTLELDISGKWSKFCRPKCSVMGNVGIRQRTRFGKNRQIQRRDN